MEAGKNDVTCDGMGLRHILSVDLGLVSLC